MQLLRVGPVTGQATPGIVLAGGLDPSNVAAAIHQVKPWAVDVSGGVEAAKGKKDHALIKAFITGVHSVSERA